MMLFVIYIVNIVESRGTVKVQHLRSILNIPINGCFPFGYPNLPALVQAFHDVFIATAAKPVSYRTEIRVDNNCILTKEGFMSYMQYGSNASDEHLPNNSILVREKPNNADEIVASVSNNSASFANSFASLENESNQHEEMGASSLPPIASAHSALAKSEFDYSAFFNLSGVSYANSSTLDECSQSQSTMGSIKLQDASQLNLFEPNASTNSRNDDGKENNFYVPNAKFELSTQGELSGSVLSMFNSIGDKNSRPHMNRVDSLPYYDPPKPDTPTSSKHAADFPFWLDPVWGCKSKSPKNRTLNVRIPDLKVFNLSPKLNTPNVMSAIAKRNRFSFLLSENSG